MTAPRTVCDGLFQFPLICSRLSRPHHTTAATRLVSTVLPPDGLHAVIIPLFFCGFFLTVVPSCGIVRMGRSVICFARTRRARQTCQKERKNTNGSTVNSITGSIDVGVRKNSGSCEQPSNSQLRKPNSYCVQRLRLKTMDRTETRGSGSAHEALEKHGDVSRLHDCMDSDIFLQTLQIKVTFAYRGRTLVHFTWGGGSCCEGTSDFSSPPMLRSCKEQRDQRGNVDCHRASQDVVAFPK